MARQVGICVADGTPRLRFWFAVQVASRDRPLLETLQTFLGVGEIRDSPPGEVTGNQSALLRCDQDDSTKRRSFRLRIASSSPAQSAVSSRPGAIFLRHTKGHILIREEGQSALSPVAAAKSAEGAFAGLTITRQRATDAPSDRGSVDRGLCGGRGNIHARQHVAYLFILRRPGSIGLRVLHSPSRIFWGGLAKLQPTTETSFRR